MNNKPKILIVDDEPFNIDYLEQELADLDYETITAINGQVALEQVETELPDLVLLDIMMPIMDGFTVLSRLKANEATRDIPVIIISANNDLQSIVKGVKQGAEDYLPKPFEPVLLQARIDAGLAKKRHRDQELEYLRQVKRLTTAATAIEQSTYEPDMVELVATRTDELGELARVFRKMAQEVRTREQRLKHQLQQLQLDIEENELAKAETSIVYIPMDRRQALAQGKTLPGYAYGAALFADVSGFTTLTELLTNELGMQRGAEEMIRHLNRVYSLLVDEVHRYGGSVISFGGDAITCWFDDLDLTGNPQANAAIDRAVACALAMQTGMQQFSAILVPAGKTISLAVKIAVAAGQARRLLIGETTPHCMDVLAGNTLAVLAETEHYARRGEILVSAANLPELEEQFIVSDWREEGSIAVVTGLMHDVAPTPWPVLPVDAIAEDLAQPWIVPAILEKVRAGKSDLLSELRPVAALFLNFDGLDYESDTNVGDKLDAFVQWVEQVITSYDGSLLQITVGDKGSYLYSIFGAPIAHHDDPVRAVLAALELASLPDSLAYITDLHIGVAYGQMRVGSYGGAAHRTYGAIGDGVNVAARLMQAAASVSAELSSGQRVSILCNDSIYEAAQAQIEFETLRPIQVKGKSEPFAIYRPLGIRHQNNEPDTALRERAYERSLLIDRLLPVEQLTLKVASVIGQIFTLDTLSAIYPEEHEYEHLLEGLQTLAALDLIVQRSTETASYSFKDPLTHETAYNLMLFAQRRQIHRALAELIEQSTSDTARYADLAHHWQAADDIPKAIHYWEKAGEYARELGDFESASRYLNASLSLGV